MTDRLGSVRLNGSGARSSYQPYGAEVTPTSDQRTKFATYYRDSAGLDYAGQRYYGNGMGRFLTPDPGGVRTADPKNPGSWNRYGYAYGDPVNYYDPSGKFACNPDFCGSDDDDGDDGDDPAVTESRPAGPAYVTSFSRAKANLEKAQDRLAGRISFSRECEGGLGAIRQGLSGETLSGDAWGVVFKNSQSATSLISSAYGNPSLGAAAQAAMDKQYASYLSANGLNHLTIAGFFAADPAADAWSPPGGGAIYLDPSRLNTSFGNPNQGLIMHELLHGVFGLDDTDIMNSLAAFDPGAHIDPNGPSVQISNWLTTNCVSGKGNK